MTECDHFWEVDLSTLKNEQSTFICMYCGEKKKDDIPIINLECLKTDKELIELATSLYTAIFVFDCYSGSDTIQYDNIINELEKRGYSIHEEKHIVIEKEEDGQDRESYSTEED